MSSGTRPASRHVGARGLLRLREQLSERDLAIIGQVAELRLMSARQIEAIHFPHTEHDTAQAAARARQRVLERLTRLGLLGRLARRIGGVRAGSASFVYALGSNGQRVLIPGGQRRRFHEPTERFLDHTLAITQLVVELIIASRSGPLDLLTCQPEPRCWREFSGLGGRLVLRPDVFLALGVGEFEHRWFIEIDRGNESLPVVLRKCRQYHAYYQAGDEQAAYGVFPRVCWIVPDERRAEGVRRAISRDRSLPKRLFSVATTAQALAVLTGGTG
jgi:hypothetical protein